MLSENIHNQHSTYLCLEKETPDPHSPSTPHLRVEGPIETMHFCLKSSKVIASDGGGDNLLELKEMERQKYR